MELNTQITELIPMIALRGMVAFPDNSIRLDIAREKSISAVDYALEKGSNIYLVTQRDLTVDDPKGKDLYDVGVVATVKQVLKTNDGLRVLAKGLYRATHSELFFKENMAFARVYRSDIKKPVRNNNNLTAKVRTVLEMLDAYSAISQTASAELTKVAYTLSDPEKLLWFTCTNISAPFEGLQQILNCSTISRAMNELITLLDKEIQVNQIEKEIYDQVKIAMENNQREYVLREQKRIIEQELGEADDDAEIQERRTKVMALPIKDAEKQALLKEINRMEKMPMGSQESNVLEMHIDAILDMPWTTTTKQNYDIKNAKRILDRDHYGMEKVKERMLELVAVSKLAPKMSGQILCLVGPPGVGKTSIAKSIAEAMGRNFVRVSLGGVRDEADIRGHRKTYVGSMPGRIAKALVEAGSNNPLILLDEIDKLGNDHKGDPSSALLEVLDREQNVNFRDHYLEVGFDLSNVLFLTSANDASMIPGPLYDRMEVIELSSYTDIEKYHIAKEHLIPKQLRECGLTSKQLQFQTSGIYEIIDGYTREAGVRELERMIAKACRKAAKMIVSGEKQHMVLTNKNCEKFLDRRKYDKADRVLQDRIGTVTGLAWTAVGGDTLHIEVRVLEGSGKIILTGNLGDVMKESAQIAVSYIRSIADRCGIDHDFYKTKDIHIHAPEGAVPKDGPSAGVTISTALLSALSNIPVRGDVAMTGEISLQGEVLPIGGLREKSMAAYKQGYKTVLVPRKNIKEVPEFAEEVRKKIRFIPMDTLEDVFANALCKSPWVAESKKKKAEELPDVMPIKKGSVRNTEQVNV